MEPLPPLTMYWTSLLVNRITRYLPAVLSADIKEYLDSKYIARRLMRVAAASDSTWKSIWVWIMWKGLPYDAFSVGYYDDVVYIGSISRVGIRTFDIKSFGAIITRHGYTTVCGLVEPTSSALSSINAPAQAQWIEWESKEQVSTRILRGRAAIAYLVEEHIKTLPPAETEVWEDVQEFIKEYDLCLHAIGFHAPNQDHQQPIVVFQRVDGALSPYMHRYYRDTTWTTMCLLPRCTICYVHANPTNPDIKWIRRDDFDHVNPIRGDAMIIRNNVREFMYQCSIHAPRRQLIMNHIDDVFRSQPHEMLAQISAIWLRLWDDNTVSIGFVPFPEWDTVLNSEPLPKRRIKSLPANKYAYISANTCERHCKI